MKKITKRYLCKLGYFDGERLSEEEERTLDPREEDEELIVFTNVLGKYYGYRVKDAEIDVDDVKLFIRMKHNRTMKICAIICTICAVILTFFLL